MEDQAQDNECSIAAAARWNNLLAQRISRWRRVRLTLAVLFAAIGGMAFFSGCGAIWAAPSLLVAIILFMLYLDARDHAREVKTRRWRAIAPRIPFSVVDAARGTPEAAPPSK